eukprot:9503823-Pyramimonas_sp.AAC.1
MARNVRVGAEHLLFLLHVDDDDTNVHPSAADMENSLAPGASRGHDATSPAQVDGMFWPTGGRRGTRYNCCVRKTGSILSAPMAAAAAAALALAAGLALAAALARALARRMRAAISPG